MRTVTVRVDETTYALIRSAADGERREISNFIENATMHYLTTSALASDSEMDEILSDQELVKSLKNGLQEATNGEYEIV